MKTREFIVSTGGLGKDYILSRYNIKNKKIFENVKYYCMFIGYPRSGHSLVGALLDAHPNVIVANELNALKYLHLRFNRDQIYWLLLEKSRLYQKCRKEGANFYNVPNQWQGRFEKLSIVGDKKGGGSSELLRAHPHLLERLRKVVKVEVKFIHVFRNPYDNITTLSKKSGRKMKLMNLDEAIDYYFSLCETVAHIKEHLKDDEIFELKQESFIETPEIYLKKLCNFLELDSSKEYLTDCVSIVYKAPNRSRYNFTWTPESIEVVKNRMKEFSFLKGYSYNKD
jgi:hypothetical protein